MAQLKSELRKRIIQLDEGGKAVAELEAIRAKRAGEGQAVMDAKGQRREFAHDLRKQKKTLIEDESI